MSKPINTLFLTFITSVFLACILFLCITNPVRTNKRTMKKELLSLVDARSVANFKVQEVTLMGDEINDSLLYYRMKISWDKCFLDLYTDTYDEPTKREKYQAELINDLARQDCFNEMKDRWKKQDAISTVTYSITYLYTDENGNDKVELFSARFKGKEMVAYRLNTQSEWVDK